MDNASRLSKIEARVNSYAAAQGGWVFVTDETIRDLYFVIRYARSLEERLRSVNEKGNVVGLSIHLTNFNSI